MVLCPCPFQNAIDKDAKFMLVEKRMSNTITTPEELYANIPKLEPRESSLCTRVPAKALECYKPGVRDHLQVDRQMVRDLPKLDWNQFYNMVKARQQAALTAP